MADQTSEEKVARLKAQFGTQKKVNPFSKMVETICGVTMIDLPDDPLGKLRPRSVKIALVSMPAFRFDIEELSSLRSAQTPPGVDPTSCLRTLVSFKQNTPSEMLHAFAEALDAAITRFKPHIVCFNELGLPSADMIPLPAAKELAWQKSQEHNVLIIAGSAHDERTLYNTGYLFRPGGPREGHSFHKSVSARSVGELVSAPASRRVVAVKFAGLRIATMICLDIADYASIASVVKVADGIDVLLVPCYTPKFDDMAALARVTSKALPGIVVMVNVEKPEASAKCCSVARFGKLEATLRPKTLKSGAVISLVKINPAEFQEERIQMKTSPDAEMNEMEFLFGTRDMPFVLKSWRADADPSEVN